MSRMGQLSEGTGIRQVGGIRSAKASVLSRSKTTMLYFSGTYSSPSFFAMYFIRSTTRCE